MSAKLGSWLDQQEDTPQENLPETDQERATRLEADRKAHYANTIQIEFWMSEWTFTNCNDEPLKGRVNDQAHMTALLKRAMVRARDEGKKLVVGNGMDTSRFDEVTDEDIEIYC